MAGTSKTNPKHPKSSSRKRGTKQDRWRRIVTPLFSNQRTFCGCRAVTFANVDESVKCPRGFPWLCAGISAAEAEIKDVEA